MPNDDGPVTGFRRYNDHEGKCRGCDKTYRYHDLDAIDDYEAHWDPAHKRSVWVLGDGHMCTNATDMYAYRNIHPAVQGPRSRNREVRNLKHDPPQEGAKDLEIEKPKFGQMRAAVSRRLKDSAGSASDPNQHAHPPVGGGSSSAHHTAQPITAGMHNFTIAPATGGDPTRHASPAQHHMPSTHPAGHYHAQQHSYNETMAGGSEQGHGHRAAGHHAQTVAEATRHYTADQHNLRCHNCATNWPWAQKDCVKAYKEHWVVSHEGFVKVCKAGDHMSLSQKSMDAHFVLMKELGRMVGHTECEERHLWSYLKNAAPDGSEEIHDGFPVPDWDALSVQAEHMRNANANRHH